MPVLVDTWTQQQEICYQTCSLKESPYIFHKRGNTVSSFDNFILEEYIENKKGEYVIRDCTNNMVAGNLFAYVFSYPEIGIKKGLLIDNPYVTKDYRGKGLCFWAYNALIEKYKLPLVSSVTQTISIFNSVWIPLSKRKRVIAFNSKTKDEIVPWIKNDFNITHSQNGKQWLLVYS